MISISPLLTFHFYVATFQQHLHMEYISLSWYDIPDLVVPIRISLIEGCCQKGSYWTKGSYWLSWSHHFERFTVATMIWLTAMEYLCHKMNTDMFHLSLCRYTDSDYPFGIFKFFSQSLSVPMGNIIESIKDWKVSYGCICVADVFSAYVSLRYVSCLHLGSIKQSPGLQS
jgi:hypothetical protein